MIGCNNAQVGEFAKFVKRRNKIAHPTGTVFFNDQQAMDEEIADMMREVRNIRGAHAASHYRAVSALIRPTAREPKNWNTAPMPKN